MSSHKPSTSASHLMRRLVTFKGGSSSPPPSSSSSRDQNPNLNPNQNPTMTSGDLPHYPFSSASSPAPTIPPATSATAAASPLPLFTSTNPINLTFSGLASDSASRSASPGIVINSVNSDRRNNLNGPSNSEPVVTYHSNFLGLFAGDGETPIAATVAPRWTDLVPPMDVDVDVDGDLDAEGEDMRMRVDSDRDVGLGLGVEVGMDMDGEGGGDLDGRVDADRKRTRFGPSSSSSSFKHAPTTRQIENFDYVGGWGVDEYGREQYVPRGRIEEVVEEEEGEGSMGGGGAVGSAVGGGGVAATGAVAKHSSRLIDSMFLPASTTPPPRPGFGARRELPLPQSPLAQDGQRESQRLHNRRVSAITSQSRTPFVSSPLSLSSFSQLRGFEPVDPLRRDGTGTGGGLGSEYVHAAADVGGNGDAGGSKNAHEPLAESFSSPFGFGFHNTQQRQPQQSNYITPEEPQPRPRSSSSYHSPHASAVHAHPLVPTSTPTPSPTSPSPSTPPPPLSALADSLSSLPPLRGFQHLPNPQKTHRSLSDRITEEDSRDLVLETQSLGEASFRAVDIVEEGRSESFVVLGDSLEDLLLPLPVPRTTTTTTVKAKEQSSRVIPPPPGPPPSLPLPDPPRLTREAQQPQQQQQQQPQPPRPRTEPATMFPPSTRTYDRPSFPLPNSPEPIIIVPHLPLPQSQSQFQSRLRQYSTTETSISDQHIIEQNISSIKEISQLIEGVRKFVSDLQREGQRALHQPHRQRQRQQQYQHQRRDPYQPQHQHQHQQVKNVQPLLEVCRNILESLERIRRTLVRRRTLPEEHWSYLSVESKSRYENRLISLQRCLRRLADMTKRIVEPSKLDTLFKKLGQHYDKLTNVADKLDDTFERLKLRHLYAVATKLTEEANKNRSTYMSAREMYVLRKSTNHPHHHHKSRGGRSRRPRPAVVSH
ncbi:hypothetical protein GYMLUDRAFT_595006 [Collybiopsis luxurians FD-317 M1]|uniref:Uncharacterized protein n=1 Tax=Collybiopsis luxurians FD-317 M1 TaxID=944289 RepID=A0A0D0CE31_9AGAR|nr:hypothetical protein GYMLUDRAFT_595006 [Collybiopsis luxurians FD-317 M1]